MNSNGEFMFIILNKSLILILLYTLYWNLNLLFYQILMMGKIVKSFCFLVFLGVLVEGLNIWPMPNSVNYGHQIMYLSNNFVLKTDGSKYDDASGILKDAFSRVLDVIEVDHVIDSNFSHFDPLSILHGIHVIVFSQNDEVLLFFYCSSFLYFVLCYFEFLRKMKKLNQNWVLSLH